MRDDGQTRHREQRPRARRSRRRIAPPSNAAIPQKQQAREHERPQRDREHAVRPAPAERDRFVAAREVREDVDVGRVRAEHQSGRRERSGPAQSGGRQRGAGKRVRNRIHRVAGET
jgi:hypothetical protein